MTTPDTDTSSAMQISEEWVSQLRASIVNRVYDPDRVPEVTFQRHTALALLDALAATREEAQLAVRNWGEQADRAVMFKRERDTATVRAAGYRDALEQARRRLYAMPGAIRDKEPTLIVLDEALRTADTALQTGDDGR